MLRKIWKTENILLVNLIFYEKLGKDSYELISVAEHIGPCRGTEFGNPYSKGPKRMFENRAMRKMFRFKLGSIMGNLE
jgi:hypothetical protein